MSTKKSVSTSQTIVGWIFWIVVGYFVYQYFNDSPVEHSYSHYQQKLKLGEIGSATLKGDGRTIVYYTEASGSDGYYTVSPLPITVDAINELDATASITAEPPASGSSLWTAILIGIVPVSLLIIAMVWIAAKSKGGLMEMGKSKARKVDPKQNPIRLADVVMSNGEHTEVFEIVEWLKEPERYHRAGARMPNGVLMDGPPGTGKTLLAKAIAGEAGVPFYEVSGSDFDEMYVGVGASRIRDMFEEAKKNAPSIIFIDEIDAVGQKRQNNDNSKGNNTLNSLLTAMQGFDDSDVIVIGATNRVDVLDPALVRPGRFDRVVSIGLPDLNAREQILQLHLRKINVNSCVNTADIARGIPNFSGAEIEKIVNEAAMEAARNDTTCVTHNMLCAAKDKVVMGAETRKVMSDHEKELTAYHEAGHAIVGYNLDDHDEVYKVSIIPRNRALGVTMFQDNNERMSHSKTYLMGMLARLYGGRIAEELIFGEDEITTGASSDIERATYIARKMVTQWGYGPQGPVNYDNDNWSNKVQEEVDEAVDNILTSAQQRATIMLKEHTKVLHAMANELLAKETLISSEIHTICKGTQH